MARVKICGITDGADLRAAVEAGADAVGVITEVPVDSPREVDPATAAELLADVPPFVTATLVTMPDSAERAVELARTVAPDAIVQDSVLLGNARIESGAVVVRSVICAGAVVRRKQRIIERIIGAAE